MSVKSKIQSLLAAINAKTNADDENLTDAVGTLIAGYGQGGIEPGFISDVMPVFHMTVTLDEDFADTSSSKAFPMTSDQKNAVLQFVKTHLTGSIKSYQIIVAAQSDVTPAAKRFYRCDRHGIATGGNSTIGTNIGDGVFIVYSGTSSSKTLSASWNPSLYGIAISVDGNITTCYATMRCNSNCASIGAGTYDVWIIALDLAKVSDREDSSNDEMSPEDALNLLSGGEL